MEKLPKKKEKRESWKERQRNRQIKQQRAQEAHQIQRERAAERKPRKRPKGKVIFGVCLIALAFMTYGTWQYFEGQRPPAIGGMTDNPPPTGPAPNFSLRDINGTHFSLSRFNGKIIAVHFMAVGCYGQMYPINDNQLRQLRIVCNSYCTNRPVTVFTVAVASCENSELARIRTSYGITWILGNDYDDYNMDIVNAYEGYSIRDGSVLLIDKSFSIAEVYTGAITAETLSAKINQLLEA